MYVRSRLGEIGILPATVPALTQLGVKLFGGLFGGKPTRADMVDPSLFSPEGTVIAAIQNAHATSQSPNTASQTSGDLSPPSQINWIVPAALAGAGLLVFLSLRKKKRR